MKKNLIIWMIVALIILGGVKWGLNNIKLQNWYPDCKYYYDHNFTLGNLPARCFYEAQGMTGVMYINGKFVNLSGK